MCFEHIVKNYSASEIHRYPLSDADIFENLRILLQGLCLTQCRAIGGVTLDIQLKLSRIQVRRIRTNDHEERN